MIYPVASFCYWLVVLTTVGVICIYLLHGNRNPW